MDSRNQEFRKMLVGISNKLSPGELQTLVYYAHIKRKLAENIKHPTDLFKILEERQDLKTDDLGYLRKMIAGTLDTRKDLLNIIDDYGESNTESSDYVQGPPQQHYTGLQEEKNCLVKHYGKGWKFFMRRLMLSEGDIEHIEAKNRGNQKEAINQCIQLWLDEQRDNASKEHIIWALKLEDRNDLVRKLNSI